MVHWKRRDKLNTVMFDEVLGGDMFIYNNELYIRLNEELYTEADNDSDSVNAVCVGGREHFIPPNVMVELVDVEMIVSVRIMENNKVENKLKNL